MERALAGLAPDQEGLPDDVDPGPPPGPLARTVARMVGLVSRLASLGGDVLLPVGARILNLPIVLLVGVLNLGPFSDLRRWIRDSRFDLGRIACIGAIPAAVVSVGLLVLLGLRLVGLFQPASDQPYLLAGLASILFWNFFALATFADHFLRE